MVAGGGVLEGDALGVLVYQTVQSVTAHHLAESVFQLSSGDVQQGGQGGETHVQIHFADGYDVMLQQTVVILRHVLCLQ